MQCAVKYGNFYHPELFNNLITVFKGHHYSSLLAKLVKDISSSYCPLNYRQFFLLFLVPKTRRRQDTRAIRASTSPRDAICGRATAAVLWTRK